MDTGTALLTKSDVRELLKVSRATLDRLIASGDLPVVRLGGRIVRFDPEAIREYVARSAA